MNSKNNNLSKTDTEIIETLLASGNEIFTNDGLNKLLFNGKANPKLIYKLIARLKSKNWLQRIERGKYLLKNVSSGIQHNPFIIAMHLVQPAAVAYWSALNFYGLTEQIPKTVFIQTTKRKTSGVIQNTEYKFVTLKEKKFFGMRKEWIQHLYFQITNMEKTIVDCFDYPEYCGGIIECTKALTASSDINYKKLIDYAVRLGNSAVIKRIGFISELLGMNELTSKIDKQRTKISKKYSLLDTSLSDTGKYSSRWNLRINISEDQLNEFKK